MPTPYHRILVPLDGSQASDLALTTGIETAQKYDSTLAQCHIVDDHTLRCFMSPFLYIENMKRIIFFSISPKNV